MDFPKNIFNTTIPIGGTMRIYIHNLRRYITYGGLSLLITFLPLVLYSCKVSIEGDTTPQQQLNPPGNGEWQRLKGIDGGLIQCLAISGSTLVAGVNYHGSLFRSIDNGTTWSETVLSEFPVDAIAARGTTFYAGTGLGTGEVFRSTDNGATWQKIAMGGIQIFPRVFLILDSTILIGGGFGLIARSGNNGTAWTSTQVLPSNSWISSFAVIGTTIFAASHEGMIARSTDNGRTWLQLPNILPQNSNLKLVANGTTLFAGAGNGVFRSTDNGVSWTKIGNLDIYSLLVSGSTIVVGTYRGIYRSTDGGITWTKTITQGIVGSALNVLVAQGSTFFAGTSGQGVLRSNDNGVTWIRSNVGMNAANISGFAEFGGSLFVGSKGGGVFRSQDNGASWEQTNGTMDNFDITALAANSSALFAGVFQAGIGVYRSSDNGFSWTGLNSGQAPQAVAANNSVILIGDNTSIARSIDNGNTWNIVYPTSPYVSDISISGTKALAATGEGILRSIDNGMTWVTANTGILPTSSSLINARKLIMSRGISLVATDNAVFRSTNDGIAWLPTKGLEGQWVNAFASNDSTFFAGTTSGGVFQSTDNGFSWTRLNTGKVVPNVVALFVKEDNLFAGTFNNGVYRLRLK